MNDMNEPAGNETSGYGPAKERSYREDKHNRSRMVELNSRDSNRPATNNDQKQIVLKSNMFVRDPQLYILTYQKQEDGSVYHGQYKEVYKHGYGV